MIDNLNSKKSYGAIDIAKFVMSILVLFLHTNILLDFENYYLNHLFNVLTRIPVPFFFIASGYFLFNKFFTQQRQPEDYSILSTFIRKTTILYLIWVAIYFPITVYGCFEYNYTPKKAIWSFFQGLFFTGENFYSWTFWYLLASAIAVLIIRELLKKGISTTAIALISTMLFFFGRILDRINSMEINQTIDQLVDWYFKIFGNTRNGVFYGLIYITIGLLIAKYKPNINKILLLFLAIISFAICYMKDFESFYFSVFIVLLSSIVFIFCLNISTQTNNFHSFCRLSSKVVYFTHMIFLFLLTFIIPLKEYIQFYPLLLRGTIILIITLVLSTSVYYLQKNNKCNFLKKIF